MEGYDYKESDVLGIFLDEMPKWIFILDIVLNFNTAYFD